MSKTIAFTQAKARLSELVDRVSKGEEFLITRHDQVVARLAPAQSPNRADIARAVDRLKELRRKNKATIEEIIAWKNEGRP
jgi:prevent-host-death family protein